ncbi:MAG: glycosyltransferase [Gammaproteobacteria bacterium]|nr:glycosyltransferase [Gammaproteobacteria bacterium]
MSNILIYTQQYPEDELSNDGIFTQQLAIELHKLINLVVVKPIAINPFQYFLNKLTGQDIKHVIIKGVDQYNIQYLHIPFVFRYIQPLMQYIFLKSHIKTIIDKHRIDLINAHFLFPDGVAGSLFKDKFNSRLILTALGSDINVFCKKQVYLKSIKKSLSLADNVVFVSRQLKKTLQDVLDNDVDYKVINNGIDKGMFFYDHIKRQICKDKLGFSDEFHILFVGRLHAIKGIYYLLLAFNSLRKEVRHKLKLHLVGDGGQYKSIMQFIDEHNLQHDVVLHGAVNHEYINTYMLACDLFCLPSLNEGQPNVLIEALACGLPVVATNVGGIPDLINDENGLLVEPGDEKMLEFALKKVLAIHYDRKLISENLPVKDWAEIASEYQGLYQRTIQKQGK